MSAINAISLKRLRSYWLLTGEHEAEEMAGCSKHHSVSHDVFTLDHENDVAKSALWVWHC